MATVLETLKAVNAYPVPLRTFIETAEQRCLTLNEEATREVLTGRGYRLAYADLLLWLSYAPDIAQGGQSYSFTDEQRADLRSRARAIYGELEEESDIPKSNYGYKGSKL